ncbi:uncharacterized protein LOC126576652 [Anopheles aquasalis]|uniref:uncharacterized protein LOC126576652 n=1 Tax=Anopheles aquasalis TaxID=42839 RepID=UPI00215B62B2|nr:uncharacterized protein LOC126576652 [Anopheles aquasalis]
MVHYWTSQPVLLLLLGTLVMLVQVQSQSGSNGDFSYFFGKIAPTDRLCAKKVIGVGTRTPVQVDYSAPKPITAVSMEASNVAYQGFNVLITRGAIGQPAITFSLNGPWVLPYYIELEYYCAP